MKRTFLNILSIILACTLQTGCVQNFVAKDNKTTLRIAGSTSMLPVSQKLADAYEKKHPGVVIHIDGGDSSLGLKGIASGIVDIGSVSRPLTQEESKGLTVYKVADDSLRVIVNKKNPVQEMTIDQLKEVFNGKIKNWSQVGGLNRPITLINREHGSGTSQVFEEMVMQHQADIDKGALIMPSTGAVISTVSRDADTIGYVSSDYNVGDVQVVTVHTGEGSVSVLNRPLLYVLPENAGQPARDFVRFCTGEEGRPIIKGSSLKN